MENLREKELEYVYQQGIRYLENRDYIRAKNCFLISKESLIYRKKSINALILIEIYSGNLKMARSLLEEYKDELYYEHTTTYAFLERIEFNLNKGLNIMLDSFKEPSTPNKKLAYLSDFYIEIGEYERARKVLETIKLSHNGTNDLIVRLIFLNIIEGDYLSAYKLFQNIDSNNINSDSYNQLKALIYYHRGILQDEKENVNTYLYYVNRLLNNDEDNLVDHLKRRHVMINQTENESLFFKCTDVEKMIKEIKSRIENLNPNFDRNASVYYVSFPNLIGYSNNETTNSVKVITALGTKKIITMYPAILSSEYNSEGLQESKELSLKRGLKWKN